MTRIERIGDCDLYLGDCREILPTLGKVDSVVTDPPYGIGYAYNSYNDTRENLIEHVEGLMVFARTAAVRTVIMCGVTQVHLYPEPNWIASVSWDTTGQFGALGYTQWMPILFYGTDVPGFGNVEGIVTKSDTFRLSGGAGVGFQREKNEHPCPKPINIMRWSVSRFSLCGETILDPFMGSGTTGVACVKLGRKFIGIEIEQKYFDISCRRIEAAYKQPDLFIEQPKPKAEQTSFNLEVPA